MSLGRGIALQTEAREGGICEEIRLDNSIANPQVWHVPPVHGVRPSMRAVLCLRGLVADGPSLV